MHKIYVDGEGWAQLKNWAHEFPKLAFQTSAFFKKCELHLSDMSNFIVYVEHKSDRIKMLCKQNGEAVCKMTVFQNDGSYKQMKVQLTFYGDDLFSSNKAELDKVVDVIVNSYILSNNYLFYGNVVEKKQIIASGKNENNDKVIVFRKYKDDLYAVHAGAHRSPEGVFSVRGHLRRYNTGKIIWIDEYLKGLKEEE